MHSPLYLSKQSLSQCPIFKGEQPLLRHLDIELTERCNNNCMHCYINLPEHDHKAQKHELTTAAWKDILTQAADLGALTVRFTGGEPLLREDFTDIYLHARRLGMRVMLFTNARLITSTLADLFVKVPPLQKIEISVYGMHPESYDTISRSPGAYQEFKQGVDLLLERKIPFVVKSVLLPPNKHELNEFEAWAATIPAMTLKPSYALFLDLRGRRDSPAKNRLIASLRFSAQEALALLARNETAYRESMLQFAKNFMYPQGDRLFDCGAGQNGCVDAYGYVQMCILLRHPATSYDLHNGSLEDALENFFPNLRQLKATNPAYLTRCARCFIKPLCEQCPAKSWAENGTLDTPVEYLCQIGHAQARYLGLLKENEYAWEVKDWQERIARVSKDIRDDH